MVSRRVERLGEEVQNILRSHGFEVEVLSYPVDHMRRSIDILARRTEKTKIFIKVTEDMASLPANEVRELRRASAVLDAKPLLVADRDDDEKMEDIIAYERVGVYAVSSEGLRRLVDGRGVYVVRRQGRLFMRIDGEKLREVREQKGYSLGDVASMLGVSRRSVYLYEKGSIDITLDKALKLLEVFGEEVFKPIEILEDENYPSYDNPVIRCDNKVEDIIVNVVRAKRARIVHMKHTAADLAVSSAGSRAVIVVDHGKRDSVEERAEEAAKIGKFSNAELYAVTDRKIARSQLEDYGFIVLGSPEELVNQLVLGHRRD